MVRIGIWAPRSATKSKPPAPTSGSRAWAQNSRTFGSRASIFLGVKTRESRPRWAVCWGGSSKMTMPGGNSMSALMNSSTAPLAELKVSRSTRPRWTSSNRLTA